MNANATPQHAFREPRPSRPGHRAAAGGEHQAWLTARLTNRDRWLARMVHEHRVLTTPQLAELAFPSLRAANHRLLELYHWRVLDRFRPFLTIGTAPMHYVLDVAGANALAHEDGLDPADLKFQHDRAIGIAHSLQLAHRVGTSGFFTSLVAHARRPDTEDRLLVWWSETRCARLYGDVVRPDGYGRWREAGTTIEFFLEYDTGTETLSRIAAKLPDYQRLATRTGITTPVLFWLPSKRREAGVRRVLETASRTLEAPALVPIATASADAAAADRDGSPAGLLWLPISTAHPPGRMTLAGLTSAWSQITPPAATGGEIRGASATVWIMAPEPMPPGQRP